MQEQIRALHQTWLTAVTQCIASTLDDAGLLPDAQVLSSWIRVLSLGRWIGGIVTPIHPPLLSVLIASIDHASSSKFGARLFGKSTKAGLFTEVHSSSLIILIEELAYCEGLDCLNQLDIILAAYVSSYSRIEAQGDRFPLHTVVIDKLKAPSSQRKHRDPPFQSRIASDGRIIHPCP